jgi:hypothetical protein
MSLAVLDDPSFRTGPEIHHVMGTPSDLGAAFDRSDPSRLEAGSQAGGSRVPTPMGLPSLRHIQGDPATPLPAELRPSDSGGISPPLDRASMGFGAADA